MPVNGFLRLKFCLIVFLLTFAPLLEGQASFSTDYTEKIDFSIPDIVRIQLEQVLQGQQALNAIFPLIETLRRQNPDLTLFILTKLSEDIQPDEFSFDWAVLQYYRNWILLERYSENEELEMLAEQTKKSTEIFASKNANSWLIKSYSLQAAITFNISFNNDDPNYAEAIANSDKALLIALQQKEKLQDKYSTLGEIYRIKGNICFYQKACPLDTALNYYDTGLEYYTLNNDHSGEADILLNKAIMFAALEKDSTASRLAENPIDYFEKAIDRCTQSNDLFKVRLEYAIYLENEFVANREQEWNKKSNEQLYAILKNTNSNKSEVYCQLAMNVQTYLSYYTPELSEQEQSQLMDTLVSYYRQTLLSSQKENNLKMYNELFKRLSKACPYFPKNSCTELLTLASTIKTHFLQKNKKVNQSIRLQNERFKEAIEKQKRKNFALWSIIFFIISFAFFAFYNQWQKNENLKKIITIKQEALRAQMNPHFISNAINAIESLVNQGRNDEASEYLIDFSRLCRLVIDNSRDSQIRLQEEIDTLKHFLALEKLRLADDLEYSISIDSQLDTQNIFVPPLLLQPFVENAIWHGIKNKPEPKNGELNIEINKLSDETIEYIIQDNGVGRKKATEIQKASVIDQKSWGVSLTKERIQHLKKGNLAHLKFTDLYDEDHQARGTKVSILLPITKLKPLKA